MPGTFHPWRVWAQNVSSALERAGFSIPADDIGSPPDPSFGELAVPFFRSAKERGASPAALAAQAAAALAADSALAGFVAEVRPAGPYVNVRLQDAVFTELVQAIQAQERVEPGSYGKQALVPAEGGEILFEYANPNTHKEIHIGHLRMFVTGVAYHRVWQAAGLPVKAVQFVNDQGVNVAKTLWKAVRDAGYAPETFALADAEALLAAWPDDQKTGNALSRLYVAATAALESDPAGAAEAAWVQARLEAHDPAWERVWRVTRDWCLAELQGICAELGIAFDRPQPYLESELLDAAAGAVSRLEVAGIAKPSQGALVVDLEAEGLGTCLVRKSNGNLLYFPKDIALAERKKAEWPSVRASYVLVDNRQALHFRQLAAVLAKMGYGVPYAALTFGILTLKEGVMSSRKGNVITYQDVRDGLVAFAADQTRSRHPDWGDEQIAAAARALAFGGLKFAILKQDPDSVLTFDRDQALAFDGMTGPYCQYAVVRLRSILEKARAAGHAFEPTVGESVPWLPAERALALALARLPWALGRAVGAIAGIAHVEQTKPSVLAEWCFTAAQAVNAFYRDVPVLDAEPAARAPRLALAEAARVALTNGLAMLTIPVPEAM